MSYDAKKVLSFQRLNFQRLKQDEGITIPNPVLKLKDSSSDVTHLQKILNFLHYDCGDPDGIFGRKTEEALKKLQTDNRLKIDGIYGNSSKTSIESLWQS